MITFLNMKPMCDVFARVGFCVQNLINHEDDFLKVKCDYFTKNKLEIIILFYICVLEGKIVAKHKQERIHTGQDKVSVPLMSCSPLSLQPSAWPDLGLGLIQDRTGDLVVPPVIIHTELGAVDDGPTPGAPVGLHGVAEAAVTQPGVRQELDEQVNVDSLHLQLGSSGCCNTVRTVST